MTGATAFDQCKSATLAKLSSGSEDKSPKGSLDAPIVDLVCCITDQPDFVTTSSCSGRIAVYASGGQAVAGRQVQ